MTRLLSVKWWLGKPKELRPGVCDCGSPMSVILHGVEASKSESANVWRSTYCWACDPVRTSPERYRTWFMIGEVRESHIRLATPEQPPDDGIVVWVRRGATIGASEVIQLINGIKALHEARRISEQGTWTLEWRDGEPWAPWCPVGFMAWRYRRGQPLPYRRTQLRASKHPRACLMCDRRMDAGDVAWRPYNPKPGSTVSSAGWDAMAHRDALVCDGCAQQADVPDVDRASVRSLRIVSEDSL